MEDRIFSLDEMRDAFNAGRNYEHNEMVVELGEAEMTEPNFNRWVYDAFCEDESYVCRNCDEVMEQDQGLYYEGDGECLCESCHPKFYTDEEWQKLHDEYNVDPDTGEDRNNFGVEAYYYTTAP